MNISKFALYHQFLGSRLLQNIPFIIAAVRRSNPTVFTSYQVLKQEWHKNLLHNMNYFLLQKVVTHETSVCGAVVPL
jgi:hypothetical protein